MTNVSDEREIFEIDVGDPLESDRSFCRDSSVWLSKRLSDGKSSEVTYHRLLPGQQLQFDEAMTKKLSQALKQEEELNLKYFGVSASRAYKCTDSSTDTWKDVSSFVTSSCALHKLCVHFGDVSSAFLQTLVSEEHQRVDDQGTSRSRVLLL